MLNIADEMGKVKIKKELRQAYQPAEKESRQLEREPDKPEQYLNAEPNTVSMQKNNKEPTR